LGLGATDAQLEDVGQDPLFQLNPDFALQR